MTGEQKEEYAYSYVEDMDIETKVGIVENGLDIETLKDWLVNQDLIITDDDIYDIKYWAENTCKYDIDDYVRENLYNLQNEIESVINGCDYIPYDKIAYVLSKLATYYLTPEDYE